MDPKIRNSVAEIISLLGIALAAIPQLQTVMHLPAWAGVVGALVITLGNQWLKDSTPPPTNPDGSKNAPSVVSPVLPAPIVPILPPPNHTGIPPIKWTQ